jgi:hypothetical protein
MATATMESSEAPPAAVPVEDLEEAEWRWRHYAIHECSHAIVLWKIREEMCLPAPHQTVVATREAAIAIEWRSRDDISRQDEAVVAMAGLVGERYLARRYRCPRRRPLELTDATPEAARANEIVGRLGRTFSVFDPLAGPSDLETVRAYCCEKTDPVTWLNRYRTIVSRARTYVKQNAMLIVACAREVMAKGVLRTKDIERIAGNLAGTRPGGARQEPGEAGERSDNVSNPQCLRE